MTNEVRIVGTRERFKHSNGTTYTGWEVQVMNEGEWQTIAICFGPASASSTVSIADSWSEDKIPSPIDTMKYRKE